MLVRKTKAGRLDPDAEWEDVGLYDIAPGATDIHDAIAKAQADGKTWMTIDPQPRRYHGKAADGQPVTALVVERIQAGQRDGRTVVNRTPVATSDQPGDNIQVGNGVRLKNPRDGSWVEASAINGKFRADVPCDSRCTNAKGNNCECSCGGVNHGSSWGS